MVFFGFSQEITSKILLFLYSLLEATVLLQKNVLLSLERFIIALCRS